MEYISAAIFGTIQGLTEFLPVSSSGHLVILHRFFDLPAGDGLAFDVALHLATLLAVVFFLRQDIWRLFLGWTASLRGGMDENGRLAWLLILATTPASLAGLYLENIIESIFRSVIVVVVMLVAVGVLMMAAEKYSRKINETNNLRWPHALFIGAAQAIALIPGTSRSGITIIAGLASGLKREAAVRFSFLLSIPIIVGASIKKIPDMPASFFSGNELIILMVAFFFSFASGLVAIKYFLKLARTVKLNIFAYYRFALAVIIIALIIFS